MPVLDEPRWCSWARGGHGRELLANVVQQKNASSTRPCRHVVELGLARQPILASIDYPIPIVVGPPRLAADAHELESLRVKVEFDPSVCAVGASPLDRHALCGHFPTLAETAAHALATGSTAAARVEARHVADRHGMASAAHRAQLEHAPVGGELVERRFVFGMRGLVSSPHARRRG